MNAYEMLNRERKARKLADVMSQAIDALHLDPGVIMEPNSVETRRRAEVAAGVKPASEETWKMVVQFLRERAEVRKSGYEVQQP